MKRMLCLFLSLVMVLGLLSGCGSQPEQMTEKETTQVSMIQPAPDAEIQKAIDLGFVAEPLQYDYDAQINYAELCGVLDRFVAALFPEKLSIYALSVGKVKSSPDVVGTIAAYVMGKAINRAVLETEEKYGYKSAQSFL